MNDKQFALWMAIGMVRGRDSEDAERPDEQLAHFEPGRLAARLHERNTP